jgi:sensor histidine kinase YesM
VKGSTLSIVVSDNGRGQGDNDLQEGVGIRNTRDRLRQLYRDSFELTLTEPAGGGFEVLISLPAREDDKDNMMEEARDIA